ncbi:ACP S-malonyltransferase [Candidatus Aerophobetes bacterium]|nr:ACP S-malonyltransferase [Candidatus Aerophobetes bacterium]
MRKIAFLYPGQGSQKVGMGRKIFNSYFPARNVLDLADKILGFNLEKLCLEGPESELTRTANLQPALLTLSWVLTMALEERGIFPQVVAGHSLGEYSAILAARVVDIPTALKMVKKRASLMEEAGKEQEGMMLAVLGFDAEKIYRICRKVGGVVVANFNCPGQVVISGCREKVLEAERELKEAGARRTIPLPVSGAFHSPLMKKAAEEFSLFLDSIVFNEPVIPLVSNSTGSYARSAREIKDNLKVQMESPVLWEKSMRLLLKDGFNIFIEVGPGRVLQGLMKRIDTKAKVFGVEDLDSVEEISFQL